MNCPAVQKKLNLDELDRLDTKKTLLDCPFLSRMSILSKTSRMSICPDCPNCLYIKKNGQLDTKAVL